MEDVAQGEGVGGVPPVFQAVGEVDPAPRSGARPQGRGLRGSVGKEKGTADRLDPGLRHVGEVALPEASATAWLRITVPAGVRAKATERRRVRANAHPLAPLHRLPIPLPILHP